MGDHRWKREKKSLAQASHKNEQVGNTRNKKQIIYVCEYQKDQLI